MIGVKLLRIAVKVVSVVESGQVISLRQMDNVPVLRQLDGPHHPGPDDLCPWERLGHEIHGAQRETLHLRILVSRNYYNRERRVILAVLQLSDHVKTMHPRQLQSQQNQAKWFPMLTDDLKPLLAAACDEDIIISRQNGVEVYLIILVIVNDEDGSLTVGGMKSHVGRWHEFISFL
jgi:hypothetical protein